MKKIHVIYIMTFSPKFGYIEGNNSLDRAAHFWLNNKGEKIGVWEEDWAFYFGNKIIEYKDNIIWEVWRPDVRADRVYEHTFSNSLITKTFPMTYLSMWSGIKKVKEVYSEEMISYLEDYLRDQKEQVLLILPVSQKPISLNIQKRFSNEVPILNTFFLYSSKLLGNIRFFLNPIRFLHECAKSLQVRRNMKRVKNLLVVHKKFIPKIEKRYNCNVFFNTGGVNLDFWKPNITKEDARNILKICQSKHVFLFSSRLVPEYQIDKVIRVVKGLNEYDFQCYFTSHGPIEYVTYLNDLVKKFKLEDKIFFTGYIDEPRLRLFYSACDTFFMTSITNAGPMSSFYALLMQKPVISTNAGLAAELLEENNCGILVHPKKYKEWDNAMKHSFNGHPIGILDREIMVKLVNWKEITAKWINIINQTVDDFTANNNASMS